jgi:hypothetical protein
VVVAAGVPRHVRWFLIGGRVDAADVGRSTAVGRSNECDMLLLHV